MKSILYPRGQANFYQSPSVIRDLKYLDTKIKEFEETDVVKEYLSTLKQRKAREEDILKFKCTKCSKSFKIKNLTLYRFVSYSNTMDNDRYEDDNIICPNCGYYHFIKDNKYQWYFKEIKEINK